MEESAEQIRGHIDALSEFEVEFGEFVRALEKYRKDGERTWPDEEYERRRREILRNAARADRAVKASEVGYVAIKTFRGVGAEDLPSLVLDFQSLSPRGEYGLALQHQILDRIPAQIAGLEMKLESMEAQSNAQPTGEPSKPKRTRRRPTSIGRIRHVPPAVAGTENRSGAREGIRRSIGGHLLRWILAATAALAAALVAFLITQGGGSPPPPPAGGFTIENTARSGVWSLNSPITSGFSSHHEPPANAHRWIPNHHTVIINCAREGRPYKTELEGEWQTWRWYGQLKDGSWIPIAELEETTEDGSQGLRTC